MMEQKISIVFVLIALSSLCIPPVLAVLSFSELLGLGQQQEQQDQPKHQQQLEQQQQQQDQYQYPTDIYDDDNNNNAALSLFSRHDICSFSFAHDCEGPSCNDPSIDNWGCTCENTQFLCDDDSTQTSCFDGDIEGSCHIRFDNVPVCLQRFRTCCFECRTDQDCWNRLGTDSGITCAYQDRPTKSFGRDILGRHYGPMICMFYHNGRPPTPRFSASPSSAPSPDPSSMPSSAPSSMPSSAPL